MDKHNVILLPNEAVITNSNYHWVFFRSICITAILSTLIFVVIFFARAAFRITIFSISLQSYLFAILLLLLLLGFIDTYLNYRYKRYIITNKRLIICTGWLNKRVRDIMLTKIEGSQVTQSFTGSYFDYGNLNIYSVGGRMDSLFLVRNPFAFQSILQEQIKIIEDYKAHNA